VTLTWRSRAEGALYSWHMKLVDRSGWLALLVTDEGPSHATAEGPRRAGRVGASDACDGGAGGEGQAAVSSWWLLPETDTALHPDQAQRNPSPSRSLKCQEPRDCNSSQQ